MARHKWRGWRSSARASGACSASSPWRHGQALAFVCQALEALLPQFGTLPFRDHEAFLFLLHAFGEGCAGRLQQLLAAGSPFRDALIALHTAMLPFVCALPAGKI